jgi:DNA repair protein RadA/Sms
VSLRDAPTPTPLAEVPVDAGEVRVRTGISEFDRALGGGLVAGSLVLIGGDPGVGKSTLLLLAADRLARKGATILYASGEESARQIRLRADRLGVTGERILLLSDTELPRIEAACRVARPQLLVLDSVQTLTLGEGMAGTPSQVREVAHSALTLAKSTGTAVVLVGHVTKSGDIAGPKLLEHLVDTVLAFEGDGRTGLRVLRAVKNRFGAAGELGLFEMGDEGLIEVPDASARLLLERAVDVPGTAVVAAMEGTRPVLAEVQALVGRAGAQMPARTTVGVDRHRLLMLSAVLGKVGLALYDRDVFANAAGGLDLGEPAADLGIVAALASSFADRPVPPDTVWMGEVGLVGEVRAVGHARARLREAARHGFRRAVVPASAAPDAPEGMGLVRVRSVRDALELLG